MIARGVTPKELQKSVTGKWRKGPRDVARVLRETLDYLEPGITIFDAQLQLVFANKRFLELRDIPPELGTVGTTFEAQTRFRAKRGDYGDGDVEAIVTEHVELARRFESHCVERVCADGTVLEIRGNPLPGGGFIAVYTDITARKRTEQELAFHLSQLELAKEKFEAQAADLAHMAEELAVQKERAEIADRAKSDFLASASHELRTPLNAILGFSQVIRAYPPGELDVDETREYIEHIYESGSFLLELIDDVLDLSNIKSDRDPLREEPVDVRDLLDSVVRVSNERAELAGLQLIVECEQDLPRFFADPGKVKQVLVNVVFNAIKFTPPGGQIVVKAWARRDSGYVIQIRDTGIGIAIEDIPKALSLFGQIDSEISRNQRGTGLGLPLSKKLVEMHSGSFDLQSELGVGTTVTNRFPAERIMPESGDTQPWRGKCRNSVCGVNTISMRFHDHSENCPCRRRPNR